jgi:hypothetical protein
MTQLLKSLKPIKGQIREFHFFRKKGVYARTRFEMWTGKKWALCNGKNGTPDLRVRIIL